MAADGGELGDGEFMGPSPPSPRAARSPLMFTPQVQKLMGLTLMGVAQFKCGKISINVLCPCGSKNR